MNHQTNVKFTRLRLPWKLKIHCWGGLGSQLFAWAMAEELIRQGFPRQIELVLHTSGVTRRESEIDQLSSRIKISKVQDFRDATTQEMMKIKKIPIIDRTFYVSILGKLGIVIFSEDFKRISPWTPQLRSHYSHRFISDHTVLLVRTVLQGSPNYDLPSEGTALHYRLGDLLTLTDKTYVSPERLISSLNKMRNSFNTPTYYVDIFSDSPAIAIEKLGPLEKDWFFTSQQNSAWNTISELSKYENLIATNSKISIWAILLRLTYEFEGLIFAPKELELNLKIILNNSDKLRKITFY